MKKINRKAFSLIDFAVMVTAGVIVISVLMPGLLEVRAAARRTQCDSNLQAIGVGLFDYAVTHGKLPPRGRSNPKSGWMTYLLPHIGQEELAKRYHWDQPWWGTDNLPLAAISIDVFECPSHTGTRIVEEETNGVKYKASAVDYSANGGLVPTLHSMGWLAEHQVRNGVFMRDRQLSYTDITDGLSTTIAVVECSGRPSQWNAGKTNSMLNVSRQGIWTDNNHVEARGHSLDGFVYPGPCVVNCSNFDGVYSFHSGGANILMVDGSVRFLGEAMDNFVFYALYTPSGGELISHSDY